jgi:integrase
MPKAKRDPANLTDFKIRALRPDPAGEYILGDTQVPGFGVRVRPSGTRTYVVMKRLPGDRIPRRITLGSVPTSYPAADGEITLAEARERAREAVAAVRKGVDVNRQKRDAVRDARKSREVERGAKGYALGSFGEIAEAYIRVECGALARGAEITSIIRRELLPAWGHRPHSELRRKDLTLLIDPVASSGRTQAAHKLREVAIRVINWAIDQGDLEINLLASPSRGRRRRDILRRTKRNRVLSGDELRSIWSACDAAGEPFATIVRLLILLGQRRAEVAGMERPELRLEDGLWIIPPNRYKTGVEHSVPLPAMAIDLLLRIPAIDERYVFSTSPGTRFSGFSKSKAHLDRLSGVSGWRLHDLRRTMRTGLAALRVDPDIAERVIGHVIGGVREVYDRHLYLDEKRDALDRWARRVAEIVDPPPDNIVRLAAAAS